jgi:membrane-associated protease RseP (regulator of RpoE activity)
MKLDRMHLRLKKSRFALAIVLLPSLAAYEACYARPSHLGKTQLVPAQRAGGHGAGQNYFGIDFRDIGDDQVAPLKLKDTRGAEVTRVDHDAPAGKMGLRAHDVILEMNGTIIDGEEQLRRLLHDCPPGRLVTLTVGRDGQTLKLSAAMADRAALERQVWQMHLSASPAPAIAGEAAASDQETTGSIVPPGTPVTHPGKSFLGSLLTSPTYTGANLEAMTPQLAQFFGVPSSGLLVSNVAENSPAAMAGLKAGDVVVQANAQPIGNLNHWLKTVHEAKGKPISITILREHQQKTLTLTPDIKHKSSLDLPSVDQPPVNMACRLRS